MRPVLLFLTMLLPFLPGNGLAETNTKTNNDTVYLFSTFKEPEQDGLRFAWSPDGHHWANIPGLFLRVNVGQKLMRDPSILRGPDGTFHMVWTSGWHGDKGFGYAHSRDLAHWSPQRLLRVMAHEPKVRNVWAPELFYDRKGQQFIICWASNMPEHPDDRRSQHHLYFTTTRDFKTFAPAKLFFDPGFDVIDGQIVQNGDRYALVFKDNTRPGSRIHVAFSDNATGPWTDISEPFTEQNTEGPAVLKLGDDWVIYYDKYRAHQYGAVRTHDFRTFTNVTDEMTFPEGLKHGTAFPVTRKELNYLFQVGTQQVTGVWLPWVTPVPQSQIEKRLAEIKQVANRGPFKPDWTSITNHFRTPQWYRDAKFGLFIHWGAYSVPAFGSEWYPRNMYVAGSREFEHHLATYGPQSKFGYKDFIPRFRAEKFDADAWAKLFREAGVKYVVPVAEHHDGFPMYASDMTDWCAAKMGPKRDLIGEEAKAYRKAGIVVGASSHRAEHWFYFDRGMYFDSDVRDTNNAGLYGPAVNQRSAEAQIEPPDKAYLDDWLLRSCEIVDKYRPQLVYFDWWIFQPVFQPCLKTFAAYYYNRGVEWKKEVAINFKHYQGESLPIGAGVFDIERGQSADIRPDFWQTDTSVSVNSWGHITNHVYKDVGGIVDDLVDIVSKNGTLLLNIGPKPDGTIPDVEQKMLHDIGGWLKINGEAIYGSRPWKKFGEGPTEVAAGSFHDTKRKPFTSEDFRFTTKGDTLYAIVMAWPENHRLLVKSLAIGSPLAQGKIKKVTLLGHKGKLDWTQTAAGLEVNLPEMAPCDFTVTLKITGLK